MSYRQAPWGTSVALLLWLLGVVTLPATALALRAAVDAGTQAAAGQVGARTAVLAAIGVAVAYAANVVVEWVSFGYTVHLIDQVSQFELEPQVLRDVCGVETVDHLERSDFLDRITVLRGTSWQVT
jgi:ATP-binding cassette subfamily B protein